MTPGDDIDAATHLIEGQRDAEADEAEARRHSPGPWAWRDDIHRNGETFCTGPLAGPNKQNILWTTYADNGIEARNLHDLALTAAAPDLLRACEAIAGTNMPPAGQPGHITLNDAVKMCHEAVAKARGETG